MSDTSLSYSSQKPKFIVSVIQTVVDMPSELFIGLCVTLGCSGEKILLEASARARTTVHILL